MSSFFKEDSILDGYVLTKQKFETVIGLGGTLAEIRRIFCIPALKWNGEEELAKNLDVIDYCAGEGGKHIEYILDKWCLENYQMPFQTVYELTQTVTVKEFEDSMLELGIRGNPSAIAIMNEVIRKKENSGIVQVNFVNTLPPESESDKEDDE